MAGEALYDSWQAAGLSAAHLQAPHFGAVCDGAYLGTVFLRNYDGLRHLLYSCGHTLAGADQADRKRRSS